jgi:ATP-dependent Lhr-like helicase
VQDLPFHALVARWFADTFAAPTAIQIEGWRRISAGEDTLIAAPTGSGKTLAAFLWAIDRLARAALDGTLEDRIHVVYVSPLKALGNDIEKNLQVPLRGLRALAEAAGTPLPEIRAAVRSGDTSVRERNLQARKPPHILITTPESLYILLTAERSRAALRQARTVIVDEIHAVAADKRGAHLTLSLERLDQCAGRPLQRIGLSATQKPIEEVAGLLVGAARVRADGSPACAVVDAGHRRAMELSVEIPDMELGPIATHEMRAAIYDRLVELVAAHRTTIVFVNTRRLVERVAHALGERIGKDRVAAHHGSLSRETRLAAEIGLKSGAIPVVVATASLELGIDVGHVDLVCHLGAPRALATLLQRVGRSGHFLGAVPKGIFFPLTRDELVQCAAAVRAVRQGALDRLTIRDAPLDVLSQQIVATVATAEMDVEALWNMVRRAWPYRALERADFDAVVEMLAEGVSTRRGRRSAHLHHDRVNGKLRPRRGARLAAITSGGAIPDTADYEVIEEPTGAFVGKVNEDFAIESMAGDIFLLGNRSWGIQRVEAGRLRVVDAHGAPPTIPFWVGEAPARTRELSDAVSDLRQEVAARAGDPAGASAWLAAEAGVGAAGADQIVAYVLETLAALGAMPGVRQLVAERFFDEAGGMQLVLHAPLGGRINRALGLALRKRFCVTFDFELQAAATDDGVVLSLGEQHSFPLDGVFSMIRPERVEKDLVQAALAAPMFTNRWRWNATRALALLRHTGGRRVPMPIQRMRAEDLLAAVFPAQLACGDNHAGPIEPVDHPLVNETLDDCLHEAMDTEGLVKVLQAIERGEIRTVAVETPAPSPMSHEILNAYPYAFLDDAPLEERRARAVSLRRTDPGLAGGIGALDPEAVAEVRRQAWPEPRDADEVHDALLTLALLPAAEEGARSWAAPLDALLAARRATRVETAAGAAPAFVAAERMALVRLAFPTARFTPELAAVPGLRRDEIAQADTGSALVEIVRGWMDSIGPTTALALAARLGAPLDGVRAALARLEADGTVMRGRFGAPAAGEGAGGAGGVEGGAGLVGAAGQGGGEHDWCERGLLARIHRLTLGRLRREIEPVTAADLMRFLFRWQHLQPGTQLHGRDGVRQLIAQLGGLELPGPAWERDVLPARVADYDPGDLERLCLAGEVAWGRLALARPPAAGDEENSDGDGDGGGEGVERAPARRRQAPTRAAPLAFVLREDLPALLRPLPVDRDWRAELSPAAREVLDHLERRGASFLADTARAIHRLPTEVEAALWELVASGLVTGDGVAGLRTLLLPEDRRAPRRAGRRRAPHLRLLPGVPVRGRLMPVGRWALLRAVEAAPASPVRDDLAEADAAVRRLLRRWGVVLRELCARERHLPGWRPLLLALRRMEARGEVRGGRFVAGFVGEQFALPEAVETLRAVRRRRDEPAETLLVAATDPLNLCGIVTPGARVPPHSGQFIVYRDGVPGEVGELGAVRSAVQRSEPP